MKYDYLIVGTGLYGAVFAHEAHLRNKRCLVIDKRHHIGGNIFTEESHGIHVHKYGAHIFHTNNKKTWDYLSKFCSFNNFINTPIAKYKNKIFNLPFNMHTFYQMWGVTTPDEAKKKISEQIQQANIKSPRNLEEQAISLVGEDIYKTLIKGYTEKQWGRECSKLPASIIKRLPVRFTYNNNYFNDKYQGIPINGYTSIISKLLEDIDIQLNTDFLQQRTELTNIANKIIFTGAIDEYFDYSLGHLEYRSLRFESETLDQENYQGVAVVNYTEQKIPYTRIIEHKHFSFGEQKFTIITKEFPCEWSSGKEPYYPINNLRNQQIYFRYKELAKKTKNVHFGGRLGQYRYLDMDKVIEESLTFAKNELES